MLQVGATRIEEGEGEGEGGGKEEHSTVSSFQILSN
jgi:hypothetical protein